MNHTATLAAGAVSRHPPAPSLTTTVPPADVDRAGEVFQVGWGELDGNAHMRNTAYLDRAADARLKFFARHGFAPAHFARLRMGPVMLRDEIEYRRELHLLQEAVVDCELAGLAGDGSRFRIRNRFRHRDGAVAATVTSTGGWLHLDRRELMAPPVALLAALRRLPRAGDFDELAGSVAAGDPGGGR